MQPPDPHSSAVRQVPGARASYHIQYDAPKEALVTRGENETPKLAGGCGLSGG